jgi:replicative DNA helicase
MPDGDPDEYINAHGADALNEVIDNSVYAIQYLIDEKWRNVHTPTATMDFMTSIAPYMAAINNKIMRKIMLTYVAGKIGMDPSQLEDYYTANEVTSSGAKLGSPDGEEIILGQAMRDPDFIADLTMKFTEDDWFLIKHRHLFRLLKMAKYTDVESIYTLAKNSNVDSVVTREWLEYIYSKTGNVEFSLQDVEDKLMRRNALRILDNSRILVGDMSQDISLTIDQSTTGMFNIANKKTDSKIFDMKQSVSSVMDLIHQRMEHPGEIIGLPFGKGFEKLEAVTLGMQEKNLIVLAANQSVGKTQMSENWELYQASIGIPTLRFSLEMSKELLTFRNLSIITGIQCTDIMTGNITMAQKECIDNAGIMLESMPMYLAEIGHDITQAVAIARRYVNKYHVKVIYVDYLQLQYVSDKKINERHRELGTISKVWKEFTMDTGVPVVLLSQLSKEALLAKVAEAEHNGGSYEVAQDADVYITLKDKTEDEIEKRGIEHGNKTLNVSKNRMGQREMLADIYADGPNYRMQEVKC